METPRLLGESFENTMAMCKKPQHPSWRETPELRTLGLQILGICQIFQLRWLARVHPLVSLVMSFMSFRFFTLLIASKPERDKTIIDLTGDDERVELRRAIQASLSPSAYGLPA